MPSRLTMNLFTRPQRWNRSRHGTTVVETALVLPVFIMFVLVVIELGHVVLVKNMLRSACRAGARMGTVDGISSNDVTQMVLTRLGSAVSTSAVQVFVKDASTYDSGGSPPANGAELEGLPDLELADAEARQLFMVRARVNYNDVAVVPLQIPMLGYYLDNLVIDGQVFMRHE